MEQGEFSFSRKLVGDCSDIQIEEDPMQQRKRFFQSKKERIVKYLVDEPEVEEEQMETDAEHPHGEYPVRQGLVLLADEEQLDEDGEAYSGNEDHVRLRCRVHGMCNEFTTITPRNAEDHRDTQRRPWILKSMAFPLRNCGGFKNTFPATAA
jgi:hypothetical protein